MVCGLCNFSCESFYLFDLGGIGRDRDCLGAWAFVGEGVEDSYGFFAGRGFAGGYVYFGAASLKEAVVGMSA
jgi:hypothetical protein